MRQPLNFSSPKLQRGMSKLLLLVCLAGAAWWGYQKGAPGGEAQEMAKLVAGLEASDVMIYGASWCPHCKAAKKWMGEQGIKFEECDVQASKTCADQLMRLDPQGGIPYFIVKGQHIKDGFDAAEFVAALKAAQGVK